jgi:hypothetical protein
MSIVNLPNHKHVANIQSTFVRNHAKETKSQKCPLWPQSRISSVRAVFFAPITRLDQRLRDAAPAREFD